MRCGDVTNRVRVHGIVCFRLIVQSPFRYPWDDVQYVDDENFLVEQRVRLLAGQRVVIDNVLNRGAEFCSRTLH